jgi:mannan endo-1,6-alpha-mannosidase
LASTTELNGICSIAQKSLSLFFTSDSITELCEQNQNCGRDAQDFKAVYVRNMAYLWRQTSDSNIKSAIANAIDTSVRSMVSRSCDSQWNCNGNWTSGSRPIKYVRSQHASAALLVAALGIHTSATGTGLLTNVNQAQLNATGSGNAGTETGWMQGSVDSRPLDAAPSLRGAATKLVAAVVAASLAFGVLA